MEELKSILLNKDVQWTFFFNIKLKCKLIDKVLPVITYIGSAAVTVSICILLIGIGSTKIRSIGIEALVLLSVSHTIMEILKRNICRKRPRNTLEGINVFNIPIDLYSFPSGHTTAVFSIATIITIYTHAFSVLCLPIALIVGISRLYLGVHFPSDIIAGIFIAIASSVLLHCIFF